MKRRTFLKSAFLSTLAICVPIKLFAKKKTRELFGLPMTGSQRKMLGIIDNNQRMMISSPRQMGKTTICLAYALETMLSKPYANVLWIAPSGGMAMNAADKFRDMVFRHRLHSPHLGAIHLDIPDIKTIQDNKFSLEFDNGSRLQFKWGDITEPKSEALDLLFFDEAAFITDMEYNEMACWPVMSTIPDAKTIMISTPNKGSWFNKKFLDKKYPLPKFQIEPSDDCFSTWGKGFTMYPDQRDQEYLGKIL